jgi:hypothetical protein
MFTKLIKATDYGIELKKKGYRYHMLETENFEYPWLVVALPPRTSTATHRREFAVR